MTLGAVHGENLSAGQRILIGTGFLPRRRRHATRGRSLSQRAVIGLRVVAAEQRQGRGHGHGRRRTPPTPQQTDRLHGFFSSFPWTGCSTTNPSSHVCSELPGELGQQSIV